MLKMKNKTEEEGEGREEEGEIGDRKNNQKGRCCEGGRKEAEVKGGRSRGGN